MNILQTFFIYLDVFFFVLLLKHRKTGDETAAKGSRQIVKYLFQIPEQDRAIPACSAERQQENHFLCNKAEGFKDNVL